MKFARVGVAVAGFAIVVAACSGSSTQLATATRTSSSASRSRCRAARSPAPDRPATGRCWRSRRPTRPGRSRATTSWPTSSTTRSTASTTPHQGAQGHDHPRVRPGRHGGRRPVQLGRRQGPDPDLATRPACSSARPANTNPDLTKGDAGKQLRAANPDKINYVRVATTDDIQGPAVAQYAYNDLGLKNVAIIDDLSVYGKGIADAFAGEFTKLGGKVVDREGADPNDHRLLADPDQVRGPQPRQRLLRWRHRQRRRPAPQADAAGRPRRAAVPRRRRHPGPERLASRARSSTSPATARGQLVRRPSRRSTTSRPRPTSRPKYTGRVQGRSGRLQRARATPAPRSSSRPSRPRPRPTG